MSSSASKLAPTPRATHVLHYCCAVDVQVQKRITDLIRVIDGLLVDMQTQGSHWKGFLDKLAVINMAHHQVLQLANKLAAALGFRRLSSCASWDRRSSYTC